MGFSWQEDVELSPATSVCGRSQAFNASRYLVAAAGVRDVRSFWKRGSFAERIEHRIEPEQRRSERDVCSQWACIRYRE